MSDSKIEAVGFNIAFIALRNPRLAVEIMKLYDEAHNIQEADPKAPDEDLDLYRHELAKGIDADI
jgi:hypothetical protein